MSRPPRWMVATFALGLLALSVAGAWFYVAQRQYLEQTASANLLSVAQAKLDQIVTWRTERLGDAAMLQESPFFVRAVARWLAGRQPEIAADILTQLRASRDHYGYDDVHLVDRAGRVLLATSGRQGILGAEEAAAVRAAFRDRRPTMSDVLDSAGDSSARLAVVAPLFASSARAAEPLGALVHIVDPRRSLFRLVTSWPSPSPSAEAVLVRRDGDSVLFLTARRFQPGAMPTPRIALSRRDVLAVKAVLGAEGVVRGVDYRGVRVISVLRAVPGTPWFLVAKVDEAEVLAVWRTRVALVFSVFLGLVLVAGASAIAAGQRSAKAHYRRMYEADAALGASEARYRTLVEEAGDGFALLDAEGRHLDVNSARCRQLGYTRAELLGLSISDIDPLFSPQRFAADFQSLVGRPPVTYESEHRRKDGTTFPVEVTLSVVRIGGVPQALSLARDITERERSEEALRREHAILARTEGIAHFGSWEWEIASDTVTWSDELFRIFQRDPREGAPSFAEHPAFYHPDDMARLRQAVEVAVAEGTPYELELRAIRKDGETRACVARGLAEMSPGGRAVRLYGSLQDITERKQAEEALRESEERFRSVYEDATLGLYRTTPDGRILLANPALVRMLGYASFEDLAARNLEHSDAYEPDYPRADFLRGIDASGEVRGFESGWRRKDGTTLAVRENARARRDASGRPLYFDGVVEDITERKRAEEALGESEERYRLATLAAFNAAWDWNLQTDALWWNESFQTLFGYRAEETEPGIESWKNRIHPDDLDRITTGIHAAIDSGRPFWSDQYRFRRKDGSYAVVHDRGYIVRAANGTPVRMLGAMQDITERKRAEEALRESEERYRGIIEQFHDVYYRTDLDGLVTMMSPSAAPLFGFPSTSEMIGRPIESFWLDSGQRAAFLAALGERGFVRDFEATAVRTDGTPLPVAVTSHWVRDASGAPDGVEGIIRDMTESKQAEAALRALALHLDSVREEEHTRIARQIHDELGQALTALRLDLTWVGRKLPKGNTALRRRIDAAVALTDETITVGQRIVEGLRPPILDDLGLVPALEWFAQHFAKRSGLRIEFDAGAEEPVVPDHVAVTAYRIVQEALTNVARHAQATHARVRLGERDGALIIEIRDDGQGFPEEAICSPHSFGIVGMRERAASHGGALAITTSPGAGTTVRVTFPLERRAAPRVPR